MSGLASARTVFVLIGAMKAGTTSVFHWLGSIPSVSLPEVKEPGYFSNDERWDRGWDWYSGLFDEISPGAVTGEASVTYSDPLLAPQSAHRMIQKLPAARIVFLVRHPHARLRSHYLHEVQRGRERRPLLEALEEDNSAYVRRSFYFQGVEPYVRLFDRSQILVVRSEDLTGGGFSGWKQILTHLGLPDQAPGVEKNVTSSKVPFTRLGAILWDHGHLQRLERSLPRPVRRLGKSLIARPSQQVDDLVASADQPLPDAVTSAIAIDTAALENWLDSPPLWPSL